MKRKSGEEGMNGSKISHTNLPKCGSPAGMSWVRHSATNSELVQQSLIGRWRIKESWRKSERLGMRATRRSGKLRVGYLRKRR
jgi:hypothetical protein